MKKYNNNSFRITDVNKEVELYGWVAKKRDLGGVIFIDLRDRSGIVQIVVRNNEELYKKASSLKTESVIKINGIICERESKNNKIPTGDIEVDVSDLELLSDCLDLPFTIDDNTNALEDTRLKYRYLDIRRNKLKNNLHLRSEILHYLRNKMYDLGFTEVQTPILTASSPEGARDFVVPSRVYPGRFYALPQAPQIYKELLMVGGFEKYFQVAPCFRDEDPRADRTLEFYQLDLEMSFVNENDVLNIGEEIFYDTFTKFSNKKVSPRPFRRIAYLDAIDMYGSDKPDLRFEMTIKDITDVFNKTEFKVFKSVIDENGIINAIVAKDAADKYSRKDLDKLTEFAKSKKASGLAYLKIGEEVSGSIAKVITNDELNELKEKLNLENNDLVLIISGPKAIVKSSLGQVRLEVARNLDLIDNDRLELCIINDFPMFEYDDEARKYEFCHNPFSMPKGGIKAYDNSNLDDILAYQYDFVCNGYEMASGAVRNHDLKSLEKGFETVGYSKDVVKERFKSLYNAFQYGVPPHAGMAPGIDRIIMLLKDEPNLREVQAFPMSVSGEDKMMGCPSEVSEQQLREIHIKVR